MVTIIDVNGAEMYAHTAWAESPDGDSFSTVEFDDADYIGTLIDRNAAEETNPTKYTWRYADTGMEEDEEDEEDEDVTADLSSDLEELADNVAEVADQVNQQQVDFINTQNVTDGAIGNVNELNGTNDGVHGWSVPNGFRISQSYEAVDSNPDADKVLVSRIARNSSGPDAEAEFDAYDLVMSLSGADAGNAYTISLHSKMSELFEIPVYVGDPYGKNIMLDFGSISNAVTVGPEDPEEEDAGTVEAAEEDPTVEDVIADEEGASETPTGEIAGADAWSWFEATAENASVTAHAQALRFDLTEMPVGASLSIANLKIEAGAMATPWRKSIVEVAGTAEEAQAMADDAQTKAGEASTKADAAKSAADSAASAAETAQTKAEEASIAAATAQTKADKASTAAATAQTKANEASAAASNAQSSADTAAQAAATAQSTADAAKASASSAANAASAAQTKANEASEAAATAQSKADSAGTAASKAQSSANAAGEAASSAQAAAEAAQAAADGAQADIDSQKEYFWHDANGAHVLGSKTAATRYRTDIDSEGMHIKDVSGEVQEVAKFTADGAQIGKTADAHQNMDYNSWKLTDKEGNVFAEAKDLRDKTGTATLKKVFTGDGTTKTFYVDHNITEIVQILIDSTVSENYSYTTGTIAINFTETPAEGAEIACTYTSGDDELKTYTMGMRNKSSEEGPLSFAEGRDVEASGDCSHAEGNTSLASGTCAHAEGKSKARGDYAHAEGRASVASGNTSHAEGYSAYAEGDYSHAEGWNTEAGGEFSHAEGVSTKATGDNSHAEGTGTQANGLSSHAEGRGTKASGQYSHAEGNQTIATGENAHAGGSGTVAAFENQTAIGTYNSNREDTLFEVGNGTGDNSRSTAFRVGRNGRVFDGERCLSDIGKVYAAQASTPIITASINSYITGASIKVPAGTYIVAAGWIFNTGSATGERNIDVDIYAGDEMVARERVYSAKKNYASLNLTTIVELTETTALSVKGSASMTSDEGNNWIKAVRVK